MHGSDLDAEAIAWCEGHLRPGKFTVNGPWPPLSHADATFDAVIACSLFTHLTRDVQNAWVAELRRVLAPGGLLLATVHGEPARRHLPAEVAEKVIRGGIFDELSDAALDQIAPENYYRGTLQTREYTVREWSKFFDVLEYTEAGINDHQDLVVLRRPA